MSDFLLELLSEEIPARMQAGARRDLERLFRERLKDAGLEAAEIRTFSTPRRLALIASGLPEQTEAVREEAKGPPEGAPDQAVDGFCRKQGVTRDQLEVREVKGRPTYFAVIDKPGQATKGILGPAIAKIVRDFPWPKSMRWGAASQSSESLRWVRPLHRIVALLGEELVPVEIDGVACGAATLGHRFHHPGEITIGGAHDYAEKLRACHVIVDHEERERIVRDGAAKCAGEAGHELVEDEGLVVENAGLTEWPVPLLGSFDPDFLDVPEEVIQLTARSDQKYFVMRKKGGGLAPNFVCTANIESSDPAAVVAGNERVLAARLSDARFFWENDLKVPLESLGDKLGEIVFHEKLGTVADKVHRVAKLARWLAEEKIVDADPDTVERAARLSKNDLVTGMVGEFPELQGIIGGHLARAQGEPDEIADAVRDHYKPVGQGDEVPTAPVTVAVSLADKLDSIVGFFAIGLDPTGSKDPFALKRSSIGKAAMLVKNKINVGLQTMVAKAIEGFWQTMVANSNPTAAIFKLPNFQGIRDELRGIDAWEPDARLVLVSNHALIKHDDLHGVASLIDVPADAEREIDFDKYSANFENFYLGLEALGPKLSDFFADRLKVQQKEAGVRHDLIDAVFALGGEDDLVRLLARVKALQAFVETDEGADLLAGYKRAANILKKEEGSWTPEQVRGDDDLLPEESALVSALDDAEPKAKSAVEAEDFTAAMAALASLRAPIDAFFDKVTVNADDAGIRARRLNLLARFRDAVHSVADFSKIEG